MESFKQFKQRNANLLKGKTNVQKREEYNLFISNKKNRTKAPAALAMPVRQRKPKAKSWQGPMPFVNVPMLSPCSRLYLRALTNPFGRFDTPPCVPDAIAIPSWKISANLKVNFQVGTMGVGYIAVDPFQVANNIPSIFATDIAYVSPDITTGAGTPGVSNILGNTPLTSAQLIAGMQVRTVGCGVRAFYVGSEISRQGTMLLYRKQYDQGIPTATFSNLSQSRTSTVVPIDRRKHAVCWRPDDFTQLGYVDNQAVVGSAANRASILIAVSGAAPQQAFQCEIVWYFEVIGGREVYPTASHSDSDGMGAVISALPVPNSPSAGPEAERSSLDRTLAAIAHASSGVVTMAVSAAKVLGPLAMKYAFSPQLPMLEYPQSVKIEDVDD